jgi:hypothetical protein
LHQPKWWRFTWTGPTTSLWLINRAIVLSRRSRVRFRVWTSRKILLKMALSASKKSCSNNTRKNTLSSKMMGSKYRISTRMRSYNNQRVRIHTAGVLSLHMQVRAKLITQLSVRNKQTVMAHCSCPHLIQTRCWLTMKEMYRLTLSLLLMDFCLFIRSRHWLKCSTRSGNTEKRVLTCLLVICTRSLSLFKKISWSSSTPLFW